MAKLYSIREKATGNTIQCNWQNAFELVNHGFWEWAKGNGRKEFKSAQQEARQQPSPEGFDREVELDDEDDDDDVDVAPAAPPVVRKPEPKPEPVAETVEEEPLEDMTRDELFAKAESIGITVDKRTGTKNLIASIKAAQGTGE